MPAAGEGVAVGLLPLAVGRGFTPDLAALESAIGDAAASAHFRQAAALQDLHFVAAPKPTLGVGDCAPESASDAADFSLQNGFVAIRELFAPSVLALAVSVYNRRALVASSWLPTLLSVVVTSLHGLFGTALACRLLRLPPRLSLPLLSRQITSPLALSAAASLGADGSLAIAAVVLTGLLGSVFSGALVGKEVAPLARGLAVGISSHGLGAAALSREDPEAFPGAAVGMALTGAVTAGLASVPAVRRALRVAVGAAAVAA